MFKVLQALYLFTLSNNNLVKNKFAFLFYNQYFWDLVKKPFIFYTYFNYAKIYLMKNFLPSHILFVSQAKRISSFLFFVPEKQNCIGDTYFYNTLLFSYCKLKILNMKVLFCFCLFMTMSLTVLSQSIDTNLNEKKINSINPVKSNIQQQNENNSAINFVEKWLLFVVKTNNTDSNNKYMLDETAYIEYYRDFVEFKLNAKSPVQKGKFFQKTNTITIISDNSSKCKSCLSELLITRNSENDTEFNLLIDNGLYYTITATVIKQPKK